MEHSEAVETMAAERYTLGEMTPDERDRFEEHFFDCSECSQSVRDGAIIADGTRSARVRQAAPSKPAWWATAAVAAALLAVVGYQNMVTIPHIRHETAVPAARIVAHAVSLLTTGSRSGDAALVSVAPDEEVPLYFDVPPENPYPSYVAEVRDAAGKVKASSQIPAAAAHETVLMVIRPGVLSAGRYEIAVSGVNGAKREIVAHYPFEARFR
ncbi:MAG: hypothetical protein JWO56_2067 [Acidobacteria bacterium]|nr:hypothetical protein [Acidobacteriota bacterium]